MIDLLCARCRLPLPPGAVAGPDGTIRNGDTVLMIATKEAAAKNEAMKRRMTQERLGSFQDTLQAELVRHGATTKGSDPYIEKSLGPTQR